MSLFERVKEIFGAENAEELSGGKTMEKSFSQAIAERRSFYALSKEAVVSDDRIREVVEYAVKHTPSAFNSQTARVVVLLGQEHDKLWKTITMDALRKIVPAESFSSTEEKINAFANAYGTVLFFEDQNTIKTLQEQFALYADNFPVWSQQSSGMLQLVVGVSLQNEGFGASLQHYGELIEEEVAKVWEIPAGWKMIAQMPFGKPTAQPGEKVFAPLKDRVIVTKS